MLPAIIKTCVFAAFGILLSPRARAQTTTTTDEREEMQEFYKSQRQSRRSFFSSAPSHHIIPKRDTISMSFETDLIDVTVAPQSDDVPDFKHLDNRLVMTGYSVFPLVAFCSNNFGVGFTGELGSRQIEFLSRRADTADALGYFFEQYSDTSYSGAGVYAFALLRSSYLPPWLSGTLIAGGRSLTAVYETRGNRTDSNSIPDAEKLKYDVNSFDLGLNVAAILAKRFTVFPWVNYRKTQLGGVKTRNESAADLTDEAQTLVDMDRELAWQSDPTLTFGLDFAVQIESLQAHLGGVFGYLANKNRGADRVQDSTLTLGLSYDLKSR